MRRHLKPYIKGITSLTYKELVAETQGLEALLGLHGVTVQLRAGTDEREAWEQFTARIGERGPNEREQWENRLVHARMVAAARAK